MKNSSVTQTIQSIACGILFALITHIVALTTFVFLFQNIGELAASVAIVALIGIASRVYYYVRQKGGYPAAVTGAALLSHVLLIVLENWLISLMAAHWLWPISISLGIGYGNDLTYAVITGLLLFGLAAVLVLDMILIAIKSIRSARKSRTQSV